VSFVVLDTDVASRSLKHELADPIAARLAGASIAITFVTLGELTKWMLVRRWIAACCLVRALPLA
jgi:predicted nucleic acid-binding protein